jgi:UrcA family protein
MKHVIMLGVAAIAFIFPSIALSRDSGEESLPTRTVIYRDLNLSTSEGQEEFRLRVSQAVRSVCGDADSRNLRMQSAIHDCRRAATARSEPMVVAVIAQAGQRLAGQPDLKIAAR